MIDASFQYHTLPGTDTVIPIMSFEEGVRRTSTEPFVDPVAEAVKRGKTPTLRDVKKSVKVHFFFIFFFSLYLTSLGFADFVKDAYSCNDPHGRLTKFVTRLQACSFLTSKFDQDAVLQLSKCFIQTRHLPTTNRRISKPGTLRKISGSS